MLGLRRQKPAALTQNGRRQTAKGGIRNADTAFRSGQKGGKKGLRALPRGNRVFERLGQLLVNELERKAFLEVSHHAGLHLAE